MMMQQAIIVTWLRRICLKCMPAVGMHTYQANLSAHVTNNPHINNQAVKK